MSEARPIDAVWRHEHPLPSIAGGLDKDARGSVLLVGGSALVPGAVRLTAEAAMRAGAGKVRVATIAAHAPTLGALMPEAAMIALPADEQGEIAAEACEVVAPRLERCKAVVVGCGMAKRPQTPRLLAGLLDALAPGSAVVIDAGALTAAGGAEDRLKALEGRAILTPHPGELASLAGEDREAIEREPERAARRAAERFGAVVALKSERTVIADPSGALLGYVSDSPGLGTAGSGDVLAGVVAGLLARGAAPVDAAAWGVWLHGQAGAALAASIGPIGFLARELLPVIPGLMAAQSQR